MAFQYEVIKLKRSDDRGVPGPKSPSPQVPGPNTTGPKSPGPEAPSPKSPGPKSPGPEVPSPQATGQETTGPEAADREITGLEITGWSGGARKLAVPETIDSLPVLSIGRHAFTEQHRGLEEVILPASIRVIRAFSFYFCPDLRKITLWDGVEDYYDGALRTSAGVREICLNMGCGRYELARRILEDSDRRLRISFTYPDAPEETLTLIFPDYENSSIEDTRAQTFHFRIDGSGFSYRECVRNDGIRIKEYDGLFGRALSADNENVSAEIAASRLLHPAGLSPEAAESYRSHLRANMPRAIRLAMLPENEDWPELFMRERLLSEEDIALALEEAGTRKLPALAGALMEYRRQQFGAPSAAAAPLSLGGLDELL